MKFLIILFLLFFIFTCAYPDIDEVPNFKDTKLSHEELLEYCNISSQDKNDIDKCINDYKGKM